MTDTNGVPTTKTETRTKERSPNYPAMTLTDSITAAVKLYEKERRTTVSPENAAKALGFGALSGPARTAIASLRQYGLIENNTHGVRLSDLAMEILHHPAESEERVSALRRAASRPPLIAELTLTHRDASDDSLRGFLITRKKFSADGARRFALAFRDALRFVNPDASGYVSDDDDGGSEAEERQQPGKKPKAPATNRGGSMEFVWTLSGNAVAQMTVSGPIDTDDVKTLEDNFNAAKRALEKAARAREAAAQAAPSQGPKPDAS